MMMSPRRCAQVGLGAAGLVLISSVAVLVNGASEVPAAVVGDGARPCRSNRRTARSRRAPLAADAGR